MMNTAQWYYGPLLKNGQIFIFSSKNKPTRRNMGDKIKYAVGPFKTKNEAVRDSKNQTLYPIGGEIGQLMHNPVDSMRVVLKKVRKPPEKIIRSLRVIRSPEDVADITKEMAQYDREHMKALLLNVKNEVIGVENISQGTIDSSIAHPREIVKGAILANAASMILIHNHPSGSTTFSKEDIQVMKRIKSTCELVGIPLLDFMVIAGERWVSAKEQGLMN